MSRATTDLTGLPLFAHHEAATKNDDGTTHYLDPHSPAEWAFSNSVRMLVVKRLIERVAPTDATVLISGESGVGKELVARAMHQLSPRRLRPFVKVNCAALPGELLESELFGHERGAFTGAHRQKPGKFEIANTGTIFLDEIGELPFPLQAKLLQVLQDHEFSRLGSRHDVRVDVRVVAATNKRLSSLVDEGTFRQDLYYRLNVMTVHVPPLRERREEIPLLADRLLRSYARQYGRPVRELSPGLLELFMSYRWPGNVRELENCVKRLAVMESEEFVIEELTATLPTTNGVPAAAAPAPQVNGAADGRHVPVGEKVGLKEIGRRAALQAEKIAIKEVLEQVRWHRLEAARRLRISYKALLQKMKRHGLDGFVFWVLGLASVVD